MLDEVFGRPVSRMAVSDFERCHCHVLDKSAIVQSFANGAAVCPYKTPNAEFGSTEVARDDRGNVDDVSSGELVQHWATCRPTGFTVVARTINDRRKKPPSRTVVTCVGSHFALFGQQQSGRIFVSDRP